MNMQHWKLLVNLNFTTINYSKSPDTILLPWEIFPALHVFFFWNECQKCADFSVICTEIPDLPLQKVGKGVEACTLHRKLAKFDAYRMNGLNLSFRSDVYSNLKLYLVRRTCYRMLTCKYMLDVRCYSTCPVLAKRNVYIIKQ